MSVQISPVWYQLRGAESTSIDGDVLLTGGHDVDQDWIGRVRTPGVVQDQQQQQQVLIGVLLLVVNILSTITSYCYTDGIMY